MPESRIEVDRLWKKFRRGEVHDSLRDLLPALTRRIVNRASQAVELGRGDFWALRDLTFQVHPGEALGVIGPNGAGKSTLLKLLTRIIRPTAGRCEVRGRIGALIEIAAGFHPDLTGRENIFLQGAIMGMKRSQILLRFDEIVDFSGISDFIDTPVKRYSSGMNARLGFSIAAHLEPDVLLIDEVLAVGDFAFQAKAFDRIRVLARQNIPVIVVSHQLERIASLCTHAILLNRGVVVCSGTPAEAIAAYVLGEAHAVPQAESGCPIQVDRVSLGTPRPVPSGERVRLVVRGSVAQEAQRDTEEVAVRVRALHTGQVIFATDNGRCGVELPLSGPFTLEVDLQMNVPPGIYAVETSVWNRRRSQFVAQLLSVTVHVEEGPTFWGSVQLNPEMRLSAASSMHTPTAT